MTAYLQLLSRCAHAASRTVGHEIVRLLQVKKIYNTSALCTGVSEVSALDSVCLDFGSVRYKNTCKATIPAAYAYSIDTYATALACADPASLAVSHEFHGTTRWGTHTHTHTHTHTCIHTNA